LRTRASAPQSMQVPGCGITKWHWPRLPASQFGIFGFMKILSVLALASVAAAQPQTAQAPLARLEGNIQRVIRSVNATWGIYIKCIETNEEIDINSVQQMDTMSVIKLPLLAEAFRQMEAGKFALTDRVTLTDAAKRP